IRSKVTASDKVRLDEYFTGIEDLEKRINATTPPPTGGTCTPPTALTTTATDYANRLKNFYDIMYFAFLCDLTRVSTFIHAPEDPASISMKGVVPGVTASTSWHGLSHFQEADSGLSLADKITQFQLTTAWHHTQVVNFVKRLKATTLANGKTLLDESC